MHAEKDIDKKPLEDESEKLTVDFSFGWMMMKVAVQDRVGL